MDKKSRKSSRYNLEVVMSKERELIKDMKILLECTYIGGLQRNADVLIGRAIELLAQPEQEPVAWIIETQKIDGTFDKWVSMNKKHHRDSCDRGEPIPLYASPQKQEPVAWMYDWKTPTGEIQHVFTSKNHLTTDLRCVSNEVENVRPLYTVPQTREPLTGKEISHGFRSDKDVTNAESYWAGVAFAEQQHNIGE
jgi:hypothetical protein